MTDKEKIRAEIERIKELHEKNLDKPMERGRIGHAHGCIDCCDEILDFIDSLPETSCPKESDDLAKLMKEVQKYYSDNFDYITSEQPTLSILTNIARYFTEWQKRKMMDGVESGKVSGVYKFDDIVTINVVHGRLNTPLYLRLSKYKGLKEGDKVKIIILPDE